MLPKSFWKIWPKSVILGHSNLSNIFLNLKIQSIFITKLDPLSGRSCQSKVLLPWLIFDKNFSLRVNEWYFLWFLQKSNLFRIFGWNSFIKWVSKFTTHLWSFVLGFITDGPHIDSHLGQWYLSTLCTPTRPNLTQRAWYHVWHISKIRAMKKFNVNHRGETK